MSRRIRLDDLVGRPVRNGDGQVVGRIMDMTGEMSDDGVVVTEFHLGPAAFFSRMGVSALLLLGIHRLEPRRIPWDRIDISDPDRPVLVSE